MYTRCPSCHTVFHLHASQLTAARGQVRCGDCGEIFQSLDYLYDDPDRALAKLAPLKSRAAARHAGGQPRPKPDDRPAVDVAEVPTDVPADVLADFSTDVSEDVPADFSTDVPEDVPEDVPTDVPADFSMDVPADAQSQVEVAPEGAQGEQLTAGPAPPEAQASGAVAQTEDDESEQASQDTAEVEAVAEVSYTSYTDNPLPAGEPPELPRFEIPPDLILHPATERTSWSAARLTGWAAVAVLVLGLVSQGIYVSREALAMEPALAPWMARLCNLVDCELPPARELADIQVLERLVRQHPRGKDVLLVHTTLVNKASFVQPYPILELRLADLSGGLVAGRRFRPSEYLPENTDIEAGMRPDEPVTAELELVRPAIDVVSYQFDFL